MHLLRFCGLLSIFHIWLGPKEKEKKAMDSLVSVTVCGMAIRSFSNKLCKPVFQDGPLHWQGGV